MKNIRAILIFKIEKFASSLFIQLFPYGSCRKRFLESVLFFAGDVTVIFLFLPLMRVFGKRNGKKYDSSLPTVLFVSPVAEDCGSNFDVGLFVREMAVRYNVILVDSDNNIPEKLRENVFIYTSFNKMMRYFAYNYVLLHFFKSRYKLAYSYVCTKHRWKVSLASSKWDIFPTGVLSDADFSSDDGKLRLFLSFSMGLFLYSGKQKRFVKSNYRNINHNKILKYTYEKCADSRDPGPCFRKVLENSEKRKYETERSIDLIYKSGLYDKNYFLTPRYSGINERGAVRLFVYHSSFWGCRRKLLPGFHNGLYRGSFPEKDGLDSFAAYLEKGMPDGEWKTDQISDNALKIKIDSRLKAALQIHAFYPDLLPALIEAIEKNSFRPDLLISVRSTDDASIAGRITRNYTGGSVIIRVVPNRGRDLYPLYTEFAGIITSNYDVIGHVHTKKSLYSVDRNTIKQWYDFMIENMIGGRQNSMDRILSAFSSDHSLGLVFPDDPNILDWGKNYEYAEQMAAKLKIRNVPENIVFPAGNMFWARVSSLKKIFSLKLEFNDYPPEPLGTDGSVLHAMERFVPLVVKSSGKKICCVAVKGRTNSIFDRRFSSLIDLI